MKTYSYIDIQKKLQVGDICDIEFPEECIKNVVFQGKAEHLALLMKNVESVKDMLYLMEHPIVMQGVSPSKKWPTLLTINATLMETKYLNVLLLSNII